jgi:hypothetical protein
MTRAFSRVAIAAAVMCMTAAVSQAGQTTSTMKEDKTFQVIAVDGNTLVVKLPEGTREISVPDDFRFMVNGQPMSVHDMKPGMKGTATITTKTTVTPVTVTEVKNGTVMQSSGSTILVRTDQGFKNFTQGDIDKRGIKIMKNGKVAELSDFHSGDKLTATIITSMPPKVMTQKEVNATLAKAAPAGAAASGGTTGSSSGTRSASSGNLASSGGGSAGSTPGGSGKTLPKTASSWPLVGLVSLLSLAMGAALTLRRRSAR